MDLSDRENENKSRIESLVEILKSKDGIARQKARNELVMAGEPALDSLITAFDTKKQQVRWEIAKALSRIGSKKAVHVLVNALEDRDFSVRWIAAEGLINMGPDSLIPLLDALDNKPDSVWLREGAHHVLHDLMGRELIDDETAQCVFPVLDALDRMQGEMETESAASKALKMLKK